MTILSKKKAIPGKQEVETNDSQQHHGGTHSLPIQMGTLPALNQISERNRDERLVATSSCWAASNREEIRSPHHNFEDFENLETGPSHSKRRHKASPMRTIRNSKLRERVNSSSPNHCSQTTGPVAGPSCLDPASGGYNSGDEYDSSQKAKITEAEWIEEDRLFEKKMRKRGFLVKKMSEDGACLFRAVADQVYGDQDMHPVVRKHCMDYIATNSDYFSQYVTEDFNKYVNRKRLEYTHGNHIEMQAMSEMYNRTIEVFCYGKDPINIFHGVHQSDNEPIRLSYQRGSHYNSIVDPHKATIGVGLGLPSFTPGAADTSLLKDAVRQSEDFHIEQTMLEDKLKATDWEATNEAIEEQVARDSYLQWLRDNEKREKSMKSEGATSTATIASEDGSNSASKSAASSSPHSSKKEELMSCQLLETPSFFNILPPQMFGLAEWEDADILAQVLAVSQQEYLDNLKKSRGSSNLEGEKSSIDHPSTSR